MAVHVAGVNNDELAILVCVRLLSCGGGFASAPSFLRGVYVVQCIADIECI